MSLFDKNGFDRYLHTIIEQAGREAGDEGSTTIEAQHLLLAIAAQVGTEPQRLLSSAGLDHQAIRDALDREFEQSLAVVGVSVRVADLPLASRHPDKTPDLGASSKLAIERMTTTFAKSALRPAHVLLAVVQAEVGTVPRALDIAGVDRIELLTRIRESITESQ